MGSVLGVVLASWLTEVNENAGTIQAISTVVLVVVTVLYVLLTGQLVQATKRSQRPYIYLDVRSGGHDIELAVVNYGERAAEEVRFEVVRDLAGRDGASITHATPLERGIGYLPPGRGYRFRADVLDEVFIGPAGSHVLELTVTYKHAGRKFRDQLTLDFSELEGVLLSSFHESGTEIARVLGKIRDEMRPSVEDRFKRYMQPATKPCDICGTSILDSAVKCPNCLEWQDHRAREAQSSWRARWRSGRR